MTDQTPPAAMSDETSSAGIVPMQNDPTGAKPDAPEWVAEHMKQIQSIKRHVKALHRSIRKTAKAKARGRQKLLMSQSHSQIGLESESRSPITATIAKRAPAPDVASLPGPSVTATDPTRDLLWLEPKRSQQVPLPSERGEGLVPQVRRPLNPAPETPRGPVTPTTPHSHTRQGKQKFLHQFRRYSPVARESLCSTGAVTNPTSPRGFYQDSNTTAIEMYL